MSLNYKHVLQDYNSCTASTMYKNIPGQET